MERLSVYPIGGVFPCRGHDRWRAIAVFTDEEWRSLRKAMGDPAWAGKPEYAHLAGRKDNEDGMERQMALWTAGQMAEDIMNRLQQGGVAAGVVSAGEDVQNDPQLAHRNFLPELEHAEIGRHRYHAPPYLLSRTPADRNKLGRCSGEDTYGVCTEILGMSDDEFVQLTNEGVLE